jgi:hypothetical protein
VLLAAYFDESAQSSEPEPISVAGYVFKPKGYEHFCRKWARLLRSGPEPVSYFHMTELYAGRGIYEGWNASQRAEILRLAIDAVRKHTYGGISVVFSQADFEKHAPANWAAKYGSIYTAACTMVLRLTCFWLQQRGNDSHVAYVFETGNRFWNEANAILTALAKHPDAKESYGYGSHTGIHKEGAYGLQAADMLAWIMTRLSVGVPKNHTMTAFRPHILGLVNGQDDKYQIFWPKTAGLKQFFEENAADTRWVTVSGMKHPHNRTLR